MGNDEDWSEITAALSGDQRVLTVDLPGHGKSMSLLDSDYTIESCAEGIIAALDRFCCDRCDLVGYSMGGRLAFYLVARYPDRFRCTIIESATPGLKSEEERKERVLRDEALAFLLEQVRSRQQFKEIVTDWYRQPLFDSLSSQPGRLQKLIRQRLTNDPRRLAKSLRNMGTGRMLSLWSELKEIKTPLLLIAGEKDHKFRKIAAEIVAECPAAEVAVIADAGHNVHLEQPVRFANLLEKFLNMPR
jgi:2-succinyl-6-hydroxy-2,4-cyclohexadiene-1-carboxylate synthase